ncbi:MAG: SPOR domain-containing protein [Alphaproteobacteria bacterium]
MIDPKPPELFAERPVRSDFARRGPPYIVRRLMTLGVLAALLGLGLYWGFMREPEVKAPEEIPTIKSEGTYKERPEEPGGLDIPHQDVQVYQALDPNKASAKPEIEHLLPPPETPLASAALPPVQQSASTTPPLESLTSSSAPPPQSVPAVTPSAPVVTTVMKSEPAPKVEEKAPAEEVKPASEKIVVAPPVPPAEPKTIDQVIKRVTTNKATASAASSGYVAVQLASLPDQSSAQTMTAKLQSKYSSVLGSSKLHVVRADLGSKGVYYRIQSHTMSEDQAKSICANLKSMKAGCIIVRP